MPVSPPPAPRFSLLPSTITHTHTQPRCQLRAASQLPIPKPRNPTHTTTNPAHALRRPPLRPALPCASPPCPPPPAQGYNQTIIPMSIIMAFLCLGVLLGGLFLLVGHVLPPLYARPLSYHLDILEERRRT